MDPCRHDDTTYDAHRKVWQTNSFGLKYQLIFYIFENIRKDPCVLIFLVLIDFGKKNLDPRLLYYQHFAKVFSIFSNILQN